MKDYDDTTRDLIIEAAIAPFDSDTHIGDLIRDAQDTDDEETAALYQAHEREIDWVRTMLMPVMRQFWNDARTTHTLLEPIENVRRPLVRGRVS